MPEGGGQVTTPSTERPRLTYHDFNLRFADYREAHNLGQFRVWAEGETPGGSMRPDDAVERTYDPRAFWANPEAGIGGLLGGLERRQLPRGEMFRLGGILADLALPQGRIRDLFQQSLSALKPGEGLRLRLRSDPVALAQLPWEFLALPQASGEPKDTDFLALRPEISIVRTDSVEAAPRSLPKRGAARVVVVLSGPSDQEDLQLGEDQEALAQAVQALRQASGRDLVELIWVGQPATEERATRAAVEAALAPGADLLHFAGHGIFEPLNQVGNVVLEKPDGNSDFYGSDQLAQLLRSAGVRLVVLGACETGRRGGQNVWGGVAPALTREQVPAVIANQFKIKDDSAILMASRIYPRVLAGCTVDEALFEARQAIYQHDKLEKRDWGAPVLYLRDKSGVLFPRPEAAVSSGAAGPFLEVMNRFETVRGRVVDVQIGQVTGGRIRLADVVATVEKDAEFTSLKIDSFGG